MFYHDGKLQYNVEVEKPNPHFAKMLQQAIGGIEGEMRVALQYLFQSWGFRGPKRYKDLLLETGTEELAHIEMLATAVSLNLEGSSDALKEEITRKDPMMAALHGGMLPRHFLSAGMAAMPVNSDGTPFTAAYVVASGNLAADMYANVMAESTGRVLATRLYEITDDPGMKDMLSFLIARDTMHQNQWLAVLEELGGAEEIHPIPNSFPQRLENQDFNYVFLGTHRDGTVHPDGRWAGGRSIDGKGEFTARPAQPQGDEAALKLAPPIPEAHAELQGMAGGTLGKLTDKAKDLLS